MKLPLLIATLTLLGSPVAVAQTFERTLGGGVNERANCIEHTNDGGYIIAGTEGQLPMM